MGHVMTSVSKHVLAYNSLSSHQFRLSTRSLTLNQKCVSLNSYSTGYHLVILNIINMTIATITQEYLKSMTVPQIAFYTLIHLFPSLVLKYSPLVNE